MPNFHLLSPEGFRASAVAAGIKSSGNPDVALLICDRLATAAAAFTTNRVVSPGVTVGREHIASGGLRGVVVNAGNANACTGRQGLKDARRMCALAAEITGCEATQILPSSTGIIGHLLPMAKLERGIRDAGQCLGSSLEHANLFADAICTTDTKRKVAGTRFKVGRNEVTIAGVCKGSGMIGPRLSTDLSAKRQARGSSNRTAARHATMLAYLTTDAQISGPALRKLLAPATNRSFNNVTVDDHASTNDTAAILASGASNAKINTVVAARAFLAGLTEVCQSLAYQIAADGEGATKVVIITVRRAASEAAAQVMARTIANSPLVKCAMNGNDPNWGRIVSAAGYAGVPFDADKSALTLQGTTVFRAGRPVEFDATKLSKALAAKEVRVDLDCRSGSGTATVWTCDLSKAYVSINADYHT
jgi:glutamate N-acetyltransferase/amino-acid N-acetyltransferase